RGLTADLLNRAYQKGQEAKVQKSGVSCFSLNPNNGLMWAHYSDKHDGICLEFDFGLGEIECFPDLKIDVQGYMKYGLEESVNYCEDKVLGTAMQFLSKKEEWAYEQEYRLLTFSGEGIYPFSPKFLSKVIFGLKVTRAVREELILLCQEEFHHVKFQVAKIL